MDRKDQKRTVLAPGYTADPADATSVEWLKNDPNDLCFYRSGGTPMLHLHEPELRALRDELCNHLGWPVDQIERAIDKEKGLRTEIHRLAADLISLRTERDTALAELNRLKTCFGCSKPVCVANRHWCSPSCRTSYERGYATGKNVGEDLE